MGTQKLNAEKLVRNEIKSVFDAKSNYDPLYHIYSAVDKAISSKLTLLDREEDTTKKEILRIVEFFNIFHFFESVHDFVRDAYVNSNRLRYGFLTNGVLLRTEKLAGQLKIEVGYTIPELTKICNKKPEVYKSILNEIKGELEGFISTDSGEKWYFWPGCEMKIPAETNIILDTSISKSKFVITEKTDDPDMHKTQIVLAEMPYELEISLVGDNKASYKDLLDKQKLESGNTNVDFGKVELELRNEKVYNYTLYVPYTSPRSDVKTHVKIFSADATVEEFVTTTT